MEYERYSEWVRFAGFVIRRATGGLPHHLQLLGIVDAELRGIRREHLLGQDGRPLEDAFGILMHERIIIQAHLWVLGVYEFIRMLDERLRDNPALATDASIAMITATKRQFSRLRVPLAKLEPESRHAKEDLVVPLPGMGPAGIAWQLNPDLMVYQEDLSDVLMDMLIALRPRQIEP
ncbi:hypothetical protein [Luteibacter sp. ME-Dv--P-043b]|uniref:hypothetical protein n=1 Tax=Luteibacter sp. ME-Dv--P-043b TaxID=3040291 RepID=UPI0025570A3C|nr:hypothetical protein [Luteibacter sp. ME-Dv--P-043b]